MKKNPLLWIIAAALAVFAGLPLLAAEPPVADVDKTITDAVAKFSYWQGLLLPVTLVLVSAIKKWAKLIPDRYLPWTAPIIGGLLDMAAQKFGLWTGNAAVGAAMGGLATWAHQALFVQPADQPEDEGPPPPNLPVWLLIGVLSFGFVAPVTTGCAWFQPSSVAAGHDAVVVGAEQTAKLSLAYTSEFLQWEWLNRPTLPQEVKSLANDLRADFPPAYADFRAATKAYKMSRSPEHRATLLTVQTVIDTIIVRVRARLPADNAKMAEAVAAKINL